MKNKIMITLLLAAGMTLGCTTKDILLEPNGSLGYAVVNGDTVKIRNDKALTKNFAKGDFLSKNNFTVGDTIMDFKEPKKLKPAKYPALDNIKNKTDKDLIGKPFRLVAIGGEIAAGYRDGGLFNEGILTSYPNLIAQQMGVTFEQPLFAKEDFNGYGRRVLSNFNPTGGDVPKFKTVTNNTGFEKIYEKETTEYLKLKDYIGSVDNYSVPFYNSDLMYLRMNNSNSIKTIYDSPANSFNNDLLKNKKFDFFILEGDFSGTNLLGGGEIFFSYSEELTKRDFKNHPVEGFPLTIFGNKVNTYDLIAKRIFDRKLNKGLIMNLPSLENLPYYSKSYNLQILKVLELYQLNGVYTRGNELLNNQPNFNKSDFSQFEVLGSSSIDSLIGNKVNITVKPGISKNNKINSFKTISDISFKINNERIIENNNNILVYSKYLNVHVVDLNGLYKKVWEGTYITNDGIKASAKWPGGNFFSSDGIFPSAFGQAIIANETIKVMNSFYKLDIPLINTRDFLTR
jgi:hypothetical protein